MFLVIENSFCGPIPYVFAGNVNEARKEALEFYDSRNGENLSMFRISKSGSCGPINIDAARQIVKNWELSNA